MLCFMYGLMDKSNQLKSAVKRNTFSNAEGGFNLKSLLMS